MDKPLLISIIGYKGRLGSRIAKLIREDPRFEIGNMLGSEDASCFLKSDVVIDVSSANSLEKHLPEIVSAKKPLVIGSTGHSKEQLKTIEQASYEIPILLCANFAPGVQLIKKILPIFSHAKKVTIVDRHHQHKKDQPSGTAKDLASFFNESQITSIREGEIVGEHTITLSFDHEEIQITHKALDRDLFAYGALCYAMKLYQKPAGHYTGPELE